MARRQGRFQLGAAQGVHLSVGQRHSEQASVAMRDAEDAARGGRCSEALQYALSAMFHLGGAGGHAVGGAFAEAAEEMTARARQVAAFAEHEIVAGRTCQLTSALAAFHPRRPPTAMAGARRRRR